MIAQNVVERILIDAENDVENEFDHCILETTLGDVFFFLCVQDEICLNRYYVYIYKTQIMVSDEDSKENNGLSRSIELTSPVYSQSFYASTPFYKRGMLSDMLTVIQSDNADTWEKIKKEFGCSDESDRDSGQTTIC